VRTALIMPLPKTVWEPNAEGNDRDTPWAPPPPSYALSRLVLSALCPLFAIAGSTLHSNNSAAILVYFDGPSLVSLFQSVQFGVGGPTPSLNAIVS
jgi:hypothetical protein